MTMFGNAIGLSPGNLGMRLFKPSAGAALWWDPNNEGLPVVGAYRASAIVGSPWPLAPANYADTLQDWSGTSPNLVEGNGAVPWAAATGWGFVAAAKQYFDTGIIPVLNPVTWSVLIQYSNMVAGTFSPFGLIDTIGHDGGFWCQHWTGGGVMRTRHGTSALLIAHAPVFATGNYGFAAKQPYRDGIAEANVIPAGVGNTDLSIFLGAFNANGVPSQCPTFNCRAFAVYSGTLTAPQVLAVATAMAAL